MRCKSGLSEQEDAESLLENLVYVQGTQAPESRDTYMECSNLKKGVYFVFVQMDWFTSPNPHFEDSQFIAVNCYGKGHTSILSDFSNVYSKL